MKSIEGKIKDAWGKGGLFEIVRRAYVKYIRPQLPERANIYNGVRVLNGRLFDQSVSFVEGNRPNYESAIVSSLSKVVKSDDRVVVVGGGWGVTSVVAARQLGREGSVVVYEGSKMHVEAIKKTARLNGVENNINVIHAIVGKKIKLKGSNNGAKIINPDEIGRCDVLELDCEGAERIIIDEMNIRPRNIIVETHGHRKSPTELMRVKLEEMSYNIQSCQIAALDRAEYCEQKDIKILTVEKN
jgi:hypothetical protein